MWLLHMHSMLSCCYVRELCWWLWRLSVAIYSAPLTCLSWKALTVLEAENLISVSLLPNLRTKSKFRRVCLSVYRCQGNGQPWVLNLVTKFQAWPCLRKRCSKLCHPCSCFITSWNRMIFCTGCSAADFFQLSSICQNSELAQGFWWSAWSDCSKILL